MNVLSLCIRIPFMTLCVYVCHAWPMLSVIILDDKIFYSAGYSTIRQLLEVLIKEIKV